MKKDSVECPLCGTKLPLVPHPTKPGRVAYHDCRGRGNVSVVYIPDRQEQTPVEPPQEEQGE